jgi:hypothetical protein
LSAGPDDRSDRDFRRVADKQVAQQRALGDAARAAEKKLRMRRFTWCRAENAVYDDKTWRLVARMAGAPLHLVEVFVLRLDLHANTARPRGSLDGFSIAALAAHWGIANDEVLARIYAALEHPNVGWIEQDHLVTFWPRNPDTEDTTAADRQDRSRSFRRAMKAIAAMAREGRIDGARRAAMERELYELREEAQRGHFPRAELHRRLDAVLQLSTGHGVTAVTAVTVTTRADQKFIEPGAVDNCGDDANGDTAGPSRDGSEPGGGDPPNAPQPADDARQQAERWLAEQGARIVTERLAIRRTVAELKIARWRDQDLSGDAVTLAAILASVAEHTSSAVRFLVLVGDGIQRHVAAMAGRQLPLLPPRPSGRYETPVLDAAGSQTPPATSGRKAAG